DLSGVDGAGIQVIGHLAPGVVFPRVEIGVNAPALRILASGQGDARWGTDGSIGIKIGESQTVGGEVVDVGRGDLGVTEATKVAVTHIVDEEHEDVGALCSGYLRDAERENGKNNCQWRNCVFHGVRDRSPTGPLLPGWRGSNGV